MTTYAQTTYYYKHTKKIDNNTGTEEFCSGGQFITFNEDKCYDSDMNGISVNNGIQIYTKINNEIIIYTGGSYWGIATYAFSSNKSLLNIILDNGDVHIYAKSNPPDNVITSSLRKKTSYNNHLGHSDPIQSQQFQNYHNGSELNNSEKNKVLREYKTREECSRCKGKKRIAYDTYPPTFGLEDYKVRCSECGELHLSSTGHTHITCPDCNGKGYKERITYSYE